MGHLKGISLFSGVGGFDIGAEKSGVEIILANELEEVFCQSLKKNFNNTEVIAGDIKDIKTFPTADIIFGGYPCQSFSLGGNRSPENDKRTYLYLEFARAVSSANPKYFIAENVSGLAKLKKGSFLHEQLKIFDNIGKYGYNVSWKVLDAKDYGVPQSRKRIFLVGVRKDLGMVYTFPEKTHGKSTKTQQLLPYLSHGEVIKDLPLWPENEFYERPDEEGNFSWYFMSRNRKRKWSEPAFTVVANWRHITLHPASPVMKLTWSDLDNGWKQRWDFSNEYEHLIDNPTRQVLKKPRRLSWRECARLQTFPDSLVIEGKIEDKFTQIGNAVPPVLSKQIVERITGGHGLVEIDANFEKEARKILDF